MFYQNFMNKDKINTQMKKGVLEYIILQIIAKGEVYASDIMSVLKENDLLVVEGTLYPLLSRLKDDKVVSYTRVESQQWPPRKYYTLTKTGENMLESMRETRDVLASAIKKINRGR